MRPGVGSDFALKRGNEALLEDGAGFAIPNPSPGRGAKGETRGFAGGFLRCAMSQEHEFPRGPIRSEGIAPQSLPSCDERVFRLSHVTSSSRPRSPKIVSRQEDATQ